MADDPCVVILSGTGLIARAALSSGDDSERALVPPPAEASRTAHDVIVAAARATVRGTVGGLVTSAGRLIKLNVLELPAMPPGAGAVSLAGGTPVTEFASFDRGETVVGLAAMDSLAGGDQGPAWRWGPRRAWSSGCCPTTRRTGTSSS